LTLETPLWIQNGRFPSYSDRTVIEALVRPGVVGQMDPINTESDGMGMQNSPGGQPRIPDLGATLTSSTPPQITIAPGKCVIAGSDQLHQGSYVCRMTDPLILDLDARPPSGSRRDRVYAQVTDTSAGVTGTDGWVIAVLAGDPAPSDPVLKPLPNSAISLADITVPAGTAAITVKDIRMRAHSNLAETYGQQQAARFPPGGGQDIIGAGVQISGGTITAHLANGTHLLHCRIQGTIVTKVPVNWINAYVEGPLFWSVGTQYVATDNIRGTDIGNVWSFHSTHILAGPEGTYTWNMKASCVGGGAWRLHANACHMIIQRIL
jgi:hypothetical protein